jgi:hypothetical protein
MGVIVQDIFGLSGNVTINLICLWISHQKLSHPKKMGLSHPKKVGLSHPKKMGLSHPKKMGLDQTVRNLSDFYVHPA